MKWQVVRRPGGVIASALTREPKQMAKQEPDSVMTIEDLALYLKLSKSTLYKLAVQGKLPGQKVGRHWRFRKESIDTWLDANSQGKKKA